MSSVPLSLSLDIWNSEIRRELLGPPIVKLAIYLGSFWVPSMCGNRQRGREQETGLQQGTLRGPLDLKGIMWVPVTVSIRGGA